MNEIEYHRMNKISTWLCLQLFHKRSILSRLLLIFFYIVNFLDSTFLAIVLYLEVINLYHFNTHSSTIASLYRYNRIYMVILCTIIFCICILFIYALEDTLAFEPFLRQILFEIYLILIENYHINSQRSFSILNRFPLLYLLLSIIFWLYIASIVTEVSRTLLNHQKIGIEREDRCMICQKTKQKLKEEGIEITQHTK